MRDYGRIRPSFWIGETGKRFRGEPLTQVIALYLLSCPSASMTGLYYLPLPTLCHETGSPLEGALKALLSLRNAGFAFYDEKCEVVWVPEMAKFQVEDKLRPGDNRITGIIREIEKYKNTKYYNEFLARYSQDFSLKLEAPPKPLASPSEGAPKALRSQEQDQEQEQEILTVAFAPAMLSKQGSEPEPEPKEDQLPFALQEPPGKRKKAAPYADVLEAIEHYSGAWVTSFRPKDGKAPICTVADQRILKQTVANFGLEETKRIITAFLKDKDKWVVSNGYALRILGQRVNIYRTSKSGNQVSSNGESRPKLKSLAEQLANVGKE